MKTLKQSINNFQNFKIMVIGDLILDKYVYAKTSRISREAPVLILSEDSVEHKLGGAGNTINNLNELGAKVGVFSIIGNDEEGKNIIKLLKNRKIDTSNIIKKNFFKTPLKTRFLAGEENAKKQQIFRLDREKFYKGRKKEFLINIKQKIENYDAVIISDYGYSVFTPSDFKKLKQDIKNLPPIFVDSRFNLSKFKNITSATPNESELINSSNLNYTTDIIKKGINMSNKMKMKALLITRGSKGMILIESGKSPKNIPIFGDNNIVDVTGAGDTVISVYTLSWLSSGDFFKAAVIANLAGALTVMKMGASTVNRKELLEGLKQHEDIIFKTITERG
jgi:rfaE bifunctional protein kinase chain/domain